MSESRLSRCYNKRRYNEVSNCIQRFNLTPSERATFNLWLAEEQKKYQQGHPSVFDQNVKSRRFQSTISSVANTVVAQAAGKATSTLATSVGAPPPIPQITGVVTSHLTSKALDSIGTPPVTNQVMVRRGRAVRRRNGSRRRRTRRGRGKNGALTTTSKLPCKIVVLWKEESGTTAKWYYAIKINKLVTTYVSTFGEFKVLNLRVRFHSNTPTNSAGVFSGILVDGDGFGSFGTGTSTEWFRTLGSFAGAKVKRHGEDMQFSWFPTEPSDREWHSYSKDTDKTIATIYFADNDDASKVELGGVLEIYATVLARGLYWNATVRSLQHRLTIERLAKEQAMETSESIPSPGTSFCNLEI